MRRSFVPMLALAVASATGAAARAQTLPYQNQSLPFEQRAADLVSRMTLEEKVQQMKDVAPAIPLALGFRCSRAFSRGL